MTRTDVVLVGGGHNGLVAAVLLARAGLSVLVLEEKDQVGGAAKTEFPFRRAPRLGASTGAYLLGLWQPELSRILGLELPLLRRDPHYFLPTTGDRHLLFGSDPAALREQFVRFFSAEDWRASEALNAELAQLREDVAPAWLAPPLSIEETAERYVRPALREVFVELCRGSIGAYLDRFGFRSDLVKAMYAVTDAFTGLDGTFDTPGTGHNFLLHNMCRLPGSGGTWMIVQGGMGTVTLRLADLARREGASIRTGARVERILVDGGAATGVVLDGGEEIRARAVVSNADPFRTLSLLPSPPADYASAISAMRTDGTTLKVNLALKGLPRFTCLPGDPSAFGPTIHLLPGEDGVLAELDRAYRTAKAGGLPEFPAIEWYIHTTVDPSLRDEQGRHNSALFVQWVPYELSGGKTWAGEEERYVRHLLSICDRFAPGTSELVDDVFTLTPPRIEEHFGITRGHIHHVDNKLAFDRRPAYRTPVPGLFLCGAGCHPGGSVIGAAGHNAAVEVIAALG